MLVLWKARDISVLLEPQEWYQPLGWQVQCAGVHNYWQGESRNSVEPWIPASWNRTVKNVTQIAALETPGNLSSNKDNLPQILTTEFCIVTCSFCSEPWLELQHPNPGGFHTGSGLRPVHCHSLCPCWALCCISGIAPCPAASRHEQSTALLLPLPQNQPIEESVQ